MRRPGRSARRCGPATPPMSACSFRSLIACVAASPSVGSVVADRGMISAPTIAALEERGLEYVLGARERTDSLVRTVVLADTGPFTPLCVQRAGGAETQLFVKEVKTEGRRSAVLILVDGGEAEGPHR